ncbi:DNA internalization-related competence protein ComEC/Rec2 [[Clostridium] saccharolyticum WM1]|uniref:DNA internalization-related competence protein ComEC/Rec2 n=2 Tax=Lacrimispora TaxID=2719231 RepID=D9R625_LACSW|nr:DNA internalization-related competence protein ComEC/Rec2 [[Clostridium] saccharolyticum WM1]
MLVMTSWLLIPAFLAAGIVLYGYWRGRNRLWVLLPLLFLYLGAAWAGYDKGRWREREEKTERMLGNYVEVQGKVAALEEEHGALRITLKGNQVWEYGNGGRTEASPIQLPGLLVTMKTSLPMKKVTLRLGQTVRIRGEIQPFSQARNPGEFDSKAYYQAQGLDCRLLGEELVMIDPHQAPVAQRLHLIREWGKEILYRYGEEEDAGIFTAAVLGDKRGVSKEIKTLYQKNGIAHLLAISGLHMSFVGIFLYRILRKAGLGYGGSGLAGMVLIFLYGLLTGGGPSVMRAAMMMSTGFLASYLGRTYDLLSSASLALLFLAFQSPLLITQGGFQLSFGAVFAIGWVSPVIADWIGKEKPLAAAVSASFAIQVVTMPVLLYHFYQIPLYSIFLNLLVIPLMGGVLCSGFGTIILGSLSPVMGVFAAGTGHYILALYEFLCRKVAALPGDSLTTGRPGAARMTAYGLLLMVGLVSLTLTGKNQGEADGEEGAETAKEEGNGTKREKKKEKEKKQRQKQKQGLRGSSYLGKLLILFAMYCLCILFFRPDPVHGLEALFLDVGQGDGILLRTERYAVLVDGGSSSKKSLGEYTLEPCLKSLGVSVIHYAFISHGDLDHLSGVEYLLDSCDDIRIENLMLPYHGREDKSLIRMADLAKKRGTKVRYLAGGERIQVGRLGIACLYPNIWDVPENTNEESEVLKMDYGNCHMLFTGDMGEAGEERLLQRPMETRLLGEVNVLKTAHHGSRYSSSQAFLNAIKPRWAVISYGEGNSYGHPHEEVLERLENQKTEVLKTGVSGAVKMWTDGEMVRFTSFIDGDGFSRYN